MNKLMTLHQRLSCGDAFMADWGVSLASLAIRWYVGWQFLKAGLVKIRDWDATLSLFRDEYQVPLLPPELAATMGAMGELALPLLLFAGLLSRPAALGLFLVNAMAVLSYPQLFSFDCPAALNDHFYWGVLLLAVVAMGPGRWSLDAVLKRRAR
jgi:putative oxidoreductase